MKRFFIILVTIIFSVCLACGDAPNAPLDLKSQQYYFEIEFINHAWGYMHHGLSFESSGKIYNYDICFGNDTEYVWTSDPEGIYSSAELAEKFSRSRAFVAIIDTAGMNEHTDMIEAAGNGRYSDLKSVLEDAGTISYKCYSYNAADDTYREILLWQEGDSFIVNTAPEAYDITRWLKQTIEQVQLLDKLYEGAGQKSWLNPSTFIKH